MKFVVLTVLFWLRIPVLYSIDMLDCALGRVEERLCPEDGGWSQWSAWGACEGECGGVGRQLRTRNCSNPQPERNGADCDGDQFDIRPCSMPGCSLQQYEQFLSMDTVRHQELEHLKSIGGSQSALLTKCLSSTCEMSDVAQSLPKEQVKFWNALVCVKKNTGCPVTGGWGDWTPWTRCNAQCGSGLQMRCRACCDPPPSSPKVTCPGDPCEYQTCTGMDCGQPMSKGGDWSNWSEWSPCSSPCHFGYKRRTRICQNQSQKSQDQKSKSAFRDSSRYNDDNDVAGGDHYYHYDVDDNYDESEYDDGDYNDNVGKKVGNSYKDNSYGNFNKEHFAYGRPKRDGKCEVEYYNNGGDEDLESTLNHRKTTVKHAVDLMEMKFNKHTVPESSTPQSSDMESQITNIQTLSNINIKSHSLQVTQNKKINEIFVDLDLEQSKTETIKSDKTEMFSGQVTQNKNLDSDYNNDYLKQKTTISLDFSSKKSKVHTTINTKLKTHSGEIDKYKELGESTKDLSKEKTVDNFADVTRSVKQKEKKIKSNSNEPLDTEKTIDENTIIFSIGNLSSENTNCSPNPKVHIYVGAEAGDITGETSRKPKKKGNRIVDPILLNTEENTGSKNKKTRVTESVEVSDETKGTSSIPKKKGNRVIDPIELDTEENTLLKNKGTTVTESVEVSDKTKGTSSIPKKKGNNVMDPILLDTEENTLLINKGTRVTESAEVSDVTKGTSSIPKNKGNRVTDPISLDTEEITTTKKKGSKVTESVRVSETVSETSSNFKKKGNRITEKTTILKKKGGRINEPASSNNEEEDCDCIGLYKGSNTVAPCYKKQKNTNAVCEEDTLATKRLKISEQPTSYSPNLSEKITKCNNVNDITKEVVSEEQTIETSSEVAGENQNDNKIKAGGVPEEKTTETFSEVTGGKPKDDEKKTGDVFEEKTIDTFSEVTDGKPKDNKIKTGDVPEEKTTETCSEVTGGKPKDNKIKTGDVPEEKTTETCSEVTGGKPKDNQIKTGDVSEEKTIETFSEITGGNQKENKIEAGNVPEEKTTETFSEVTGGKPKDDEKNTRDVFEEKTIDTFSEVTGGNQKEDKIKANSVFAQKSTLNLNTTLNYNTYQSFLSSPSVKIPSTTPIQGESSKVNKITTLSYKKTTPKVSLISINTTTSTFENGTEDEPIKSKIKNTSAIPALDSNEISEGPQGGRRNMTGVRPIGCDLSNKLTLPGFKDSYPAEGCRGPFEELKPCNTEPCNEDGGWSDWSSWSPCIPECGLGWQASVRSCTNPEPRNAMQQCSGEATRRQACYRFPCPVTTRTTKAVFMTGDSVVKYEALNQHFSILLLYVRLRHFSPSGSIVTRRRHDCSHERCNHVTLSIYRSHVLVSVRQQKCHGDFLTSQRMMVGEWHDILLTVVGTTVTLRLDDKALVQTFALSCRPTSPNYDMDMRVGGSRFVGEVDRLIVNFKNYVFQKSRSKRESLSLIDDDTVMPVESTQVQYEVNSKDIPTVSLSHFLQAPCFSNHSSWNIELAIKPNFPDGLVLFMKGYDSRDFLFVSLEQTRIRLRIRVSSLAGECELAERVAPLTWVHLGLSRTAEGGGVGLSVNGGPHCMVNMAPPATEEPTVYCSGGILMGEMPHSVKTVLSLDEGHFEPLHSPLGLLGHLVVDNHTIDLSRLSRKIAPDMLVQHTDAEYRLSSHTAATTVYYEEMLVLQGERVSMPCIFDLAPDNMTDHNSVKELNNNWYKLDVPVKSAFSNESGVQYETPTTSKAVSLNITSYPSPQSVEGFYSCWLHYPLPLQAGINIVTYGVVIISGSQDKRTWLFWLLTAHLCFVIILLVLLALLLVFEAIQDLRRGSGFYRCKKLKGSEALEAAKLFILSDKAVNRLGGMENAELALNRYTEHLEQEAQASAPQETPAETDATADENEANQSPVDEDRVEEIKERKVYRTSLNLTPVNPYDSKNKGQKVTIGMAEVELNSPFMKGKSYSSSWSESRITIEELLQSDGEGTGEGSNIASKNDNLIDVSDRWTQKHVAGFASKETSTTGIGQIQKTNAYQSIENELKFKPEKFENLGKYMYSKKNITDS